MFVRVVALMLLAAVASTADDRLPVVVELFTSEGCSSCPAADEMLARLERTQPVPNARVIALEEHVDYWNQLGWNDRFSSPLFRGRQNEYAGVFRIDSIYTPQVVVNGGAAFAGGDMPLAMREIGRAASNPSYSLVLDSRPNPKDPALVDLAVMVRNSQQGKPEPADVYLAVTESRLTSNVNGGENTGRLLRHADVVRSFGVIGSVEAHAFREAGLRNTLKLPGDWKRENLKAVVFVQQKATRRIVGASVVDLRQ